MDTACLKDILEHLTAIELTAVARTSKLWAKYADEIGIVNEVDAYYTRAIRASNVYAFCKHSNLWTIDFFIDHIDLIRDAICQGSLDILKWAHKLHGVIPPTTSDDAAMHGHVHILKWLANLDMCANIWSVGSVDVLKWLKNQHPKMANISTITETAVDDGRLDIIKWLDHDGYFDRDGFQGSRYHYIYRALREGHIDVVEWFVARDRGGLSQVCDHVKTKKVFDWVLKHVNEIDSESKYKCIMEYREYEEYDHVNWSTIDHHMMPQVVDCSAKLGKLDILNCFIAQGATINSRTFAKAALSGNLEMLEMLRTRGVPWDAMLARNAAKQGHYHVLEWARAHGVPISSRAYEWPLRDGNIAMLDYLYSIDAPISVNCVSHVLMFNQFNALKWLIAHGGTWGLRANSIMGLTISTNNLKLIKWVEENGFVISDKIIDFARCTPHMNCKEAIKMFKAMGKI